MIFKCDKCGAELDTIVMCSITVEAVKNFERPVKNFERHELCMECYKKFKKWVAEGKEPAERDCEHCVHRTELDRNGMIIKGCSEWDCHFKRRTDADSN